MEHKLKLSEIVKYLLLGAISAMLIDVTLLYFYGVNPLSMLDIDSVGSYVGDKSLVTLLAIVALSYLSGLLIHTLNELLLFTYHNTYKKLAYYSTLLMPKYDMRGDVMLWVKYRANCLLCNLLSPIYYHTIDDVCIRLHRNGENGEIHQEWIPAWVSLSYRPDNVLRLLAEKIAQRGQGNNTEFLYLHEFIMGLRSTLIISLLIAVASLLFCEGVALSDVGLLLGGVAVSWWLLSCVAKVFAIKYIMYINSCHEVDKYSHEMEKNRDNMRSILFNNGLPSAYIMVRTTSTSMKDENNHFADDIVKSILAQDYPNITVIVYEDLGERPAVMPKVDEKYTNPIVAKLSGLRHIDVIYCADYLASAAQSSLEIRKVFVNAATENDVAILLDDDDEFATADAVSNIMIRMAQYNADICMIGYNEVSQRGLSIINNSGDYADLLQEVSDLNRSVTYDNIPGIYRAATMGWTKCYKRSVLKKYCRLVAVCDAERAITHERSFGELKAYEDFPDYVTMLFKDCKIVAINQALYNYRKQGNSITATLTRESFEVQRIGFLVYMEQLMKPTISQYFEPETLDLLDQFLSYKLGVIEAILQKKNDDGTVDFPVEQFKAEYSAQRARILRRD